MERLFLPLVNSLLVVTLFSNSAKADEPCIPANSKVNVQFDRPSLGQSGDPVTATWTGDNGSGSPFAYEKDIIDPDDFMGWAKPGSVAHTATVEIENKSGVLSGPNGKQQNGGVEGDCIEVYCGWSYRYQATVQKCVQVAPQGIGGSQCEEVTVWRIGFKFSQTKTVCPC
jgi:hypothetical protein